MTESTPAPLYCANHPQRETSLRCNRCEKPICPQCAVLTPTGYRCKECVRGQQQRYNTAVWLDYPLAFVAAGLISYLGSLVIGMIGFFTLILAPFVGIAVAEAIRFVIRRRRAPGLYAVSTVATVLGSLVVLLPSLVALLLYPGVTGSSTFFSLYWLAIRGLYTVLVTTSMYYRLTGRQLKL